MIWSLVWLQPPAKLRIKLLTVFLRGGFPPISQGWFQSFWYFISSLRLTLQYPWQFDVYSTATEFCVNIHKSKIPKRTHNFRRIKRNIGGWEGKGWIEPLLTIMSKVKFSPLSTTSFCFIFLTALRTIWHYLVYLFEYFLVLGYHSRYIPWQHYLVCLVHHVFWTPRKCLA